MALGYTVNWMEQGRNPVEETGADSYEVIDVDYRTLYEVILPAGIPTGRTLRQTRKRIGTKNVSYSITHCDITYKAVTITASGATTQITAAQAAEIQADAYTSTACQSCTTSREDGPNFSVTKVERSTNLRSSGGSNISWGDWGDWVPPPPTANS